jgi:hypothetical protein
MTRDTTIIITVAGDELIEIIHSHLKKKRLLGGIPDQAETSLFNSTEVSIEYSWSDV